jgi:Activator of Hsp90 ATPase homolog 1-like protein
MSDASGGGEVQLEIRIDASRRDLHRGHPKSESGIHLGWRGRSQARQSTVEFLLEPDGGGTLVRLRHYRLPKPAVESHRRGWVYSGLVKLKDAAEGRTPSGLCLSDIARLGGAG